MEGHRQSQQSIRKYREKGVPAAPDTEGGRRQAGGPRESWCRGQGAEGRGWECRLQTGPQFPGREAHRCGIPCFTAGMAEQALPCLGLSADREKPQGPEGRAGMSEKGTISTAVPGLPTFLLSTSHPYRLGMPLGSLEDWQGHTGWEGQPCFLLSHLGRGQPGIQWEGQCMWPRRREEDLPAYPPRTPCPWARASARAAAPWAAEGLKDAQCPHSHGTAGCPLGHASKQGTGHRMDGECRKPAPPVTPWQWGQALSCLLLSPLCFAPIRAQSRAVLAKGEL